MKRYQKIMMGLLTLSTLAMAEECCWTEKFEVCKVCSFEEELVPPSFTLGAPSGIPGGKGGGGMAVSGITDKDDTDGGLAFGVGYGDPNKIGGLVSLSIGSVNPVDGGAFNRGALNISAGHSFPDQLIGVSVGVNDIDLWHANHDDHDDDPSLYISATKIIPYNRYPVMLTAGLGNNNFAKVNETGDKKDHVYPFVSGAVYVTPQISLIADYTSDIVTLGAGIVPFPKLPVAFTLGAYDIGKEREEDKVSFIASMAISVRF
ncbi:hypothetical protein [Fusobacterium sp. MFO224]|uniref:hypothetical protein n=1 Tax=Fusobacterium sp. MFO224 TaxID=3378070 RepID=UPI003852C7DF